MASLNHYMFKKMIQDEKSKLSDKAILTSNAMRNFLTVIAESITKMYHRKLSVTVLWDESEDAQVGWSTARNEIFINADNLLARGKTRIEKFRIVIGIFLHEAAHLLYSDFYLLSKWGKSIENDHQLYPLPKHKNAEKVKEFLDEYPKCTTLFLNIMHNIFNCIEDGYVDRRIMKEIPGYAKERKEVRHSIYSSSVKSFSEMKDSGCDDFQILMSLIFSYGKFQSVNATIDELKSETVCRKFKSIVPLIDKTLAEQNSYCRFQYMNEIICVIFQYIKDEIEKLIDDDSEDKEDAEETGEKDCSKEESDDGGSDSATGSGASGGDSSKAKDSPEFDKTPSEDSVEKAMSKIISMLASSAEHDGFDGMESRPADWSKEDEKSAKAEDSKKSDSTETEITDDELIKKPEDVSPEDDDSSMSALARITDDKATEDAGKKYEAELKKEMDVIDKGTSYGDCHEDTTRVIDRSIDIPETYYSAYEKYRTELGPISKRTQKALIKEIKDRQQGWRLNGLYSGNRISPHDCYRQDGKKFTKNRLPEDIPDMAVLLLLDESGSMSGERIEAARKTAWVIYDFCTSLHIPVSIVGHSEDFYGRHSVRLTNYANFESVDSKDKYRLMGIRAKENNRDGYALRYCAEMLSKRQEEVKLLFCVSDGVPAATGYGFANGKRDIQNVLREYAKKHILFITAGIGSDVDRIKNIYTDGLSDKNAAKFLNIEDLDMLPKSFIKIIKKYLE